MSPPSRDVSICDWVERTHGTTLRRAVSLTADHKKEHGFTISGYPGDTSTTNIVSGSETSLPQIDEAAPDYYRPVRVLVHTHPSGSVVLSDSDWRSFLHKLGLYGPDKQFPDGWRRGFVVASPNRDGETFTVRGVELTARGAAISPNAQHEWVGDAIETVENWTAITQGGFEDLLNAIGPEVRGCTSEFDLLHA